jgi:hypothetical protein
MTLYSFRVAETYIVGQKNLWQELYAYHGFNNPRMDPIENTGRTVYASKI